MATQTLPIPYVRSTIPTLAGGDGQYLQSELGRIQNSINSLVLFAPQPATKAPAQTADGMVRLARSPWWPVAGQTADAWVYYDATTSSWRFLNGT